MPIKLWSDDAHNFVDARTGERVTADELIDLAVAYRTLPADRQAVRRAYVEALLARESGQRPHWIAPRTAALDALPARSRSRDRIRRTGGLHRIPMPRSDTGVYSGVNRISMRIRSRGI
jgi:hypothetical protein